MNIFSKLAKRINKSRKFADLKKNNIYIHPDSEIGNFISIGYGTQINGSAFIASNDEAAVSIGKHCMIAHNLRIRSRDHYTGYINMQRKFQNTYNHPKVTTTKGPVNIGHGVWIGDNVIVLSGVQIGNGAVIGAGSIVTKNILPYAIAVGNPARVIKKRFDETIIKQLLEVEWWDWSEEKIGKNNTFFETDFSKISSEDDFDVHQIIV